MFGRFRRKPNAGMSRAAALTLDPQSPIQADMLARLRLREVGTTAEEKKMLVQFVSAPASWNNGPATIQMASASQDALSGSAPAELVLTAATAMRSGLSIDAVEQAFMRQGWRYDRQGTSIRTRFEGVPMLISVDSSHSAIRIVVPIFATGPRTPRPSAARERDIDTFLNAVNYVLPIGTFIRDLDDGDIYYMVSLRAAGGVVDDEELAAAIAVAVINAAFGPAVQRLASGELSLNQALSMLKQLQADAARGSRTA